MSMEKLSVNCPQKGPRNICQVIGTVGLTLPKRFREGPLGDELFKLMDSAQRKAPEAQQLEWQKLGSLVSTHVGPSNGVQWKENLSAILQNRSLPHRWRPNKT
jgi:hypothetical protein